MVVRARAPEDTAVQASGLWVHRGGAPTMSRFHRHDDLELNVVLEGQLEYLFGGERLVVHGGHTALFWAATPHRLLHSAGAVTSDVCWVHVPLATALSWSLPPGFGSEILAQRKVIVPTAVVGDHVRAQFTTWQRDLAAGADPQSLLLEVNAMVVRILAARPPRTSSGRHRGHRSDRGDSTGHDLGPVATMARFTAERFRDPISTADIARSASLNPNYATTLFRRSVGVTLGEQLVRHRIAEAQRLLITTSLTTSAVAYASGFGSTSSMYAHFTRACGCAPGEYRAARTAVSDS